MFYILVTDAAIDLLDFLYITGELELGAGPRDSLSTPLKINYLLIAHCINQLRGQGDGANVFPSPETPKNLQRMKNNPRLSQQWASRAKENSNFR